MGSSMRSFQQDEGEPQELSLAPEISCFDETKESKYAARTREAGMQSFLYVGAFR